MRLVLKTVSFQSALMGGDAEKVFDESGGTFGRSASNDWLLPDPKRYISSKHGEVYFQDGRYFVTDVSTNGLKIEGQAKVIGNGNSVPLNHGDVLLLGEFRLEVGLEESAVQPDPGGGGVVDILENSAAGGSLDPLDFMLPESSSAAAAEGSWSESQADDSSLAHDHFSLPGERNSPFPPQDKPLVDKGSAPFVAVAQMDSDKSAFADSVGMIPDDWNLTEMNSEQGVSQDAKDELQSSAIGEPPFPPETSILPEEESVDSLSKQIDPEAVFYEGSGIGLECQPENTHRLEPFPSGSTDEEGAGKEAANELAQETAQETMHEASAGGTTSTHEALLYEAFLQGMGIADIACTEVSVETMRSYGELLRLMIESLMELLSSRANFKSEFRLSRTMLKPVENNPLKFSPNVGEAIRIFFSPENSGYLGLQESVGDGLENMKYHQVALIAGLQAIFLEFSNLMSPERYTADSTRGVRGLLHSITQKSRNWEQFCAYCERLERESANGISGYFSDVFTEAYEERIIMLKNIGSGKVSV